MDFNKKNWVQHRHAPTILGEHKAIYTGWWLTYPSEKYESQLG
jgi:hypothetical protein